mmetsp:Transcript_54270/g.173987  ORF Transcript_54270/g.173987 Transcript_54270/m.173987 type:complete len:143 (+) Transcript_54270:84-512(+)
MGEATSRCCCQSEGCEFEQKDITIKKEPPPGTANLPFLDPAGGNAKSSARGMLPPLRDEYCITLDKSQGGRLGIDVDHQDGATLLIEYINGGLVGAWNQSNPDLCVKAGDRIVEVNSVSNDVILLVEECKQNKELRMRLRRA